MNKGITLTKYDTSNIHKQKRKEKATKNRVPKQKKVIKKKIKIG